MTDTSTVWDVAHGRGDWVVNPTTLTQTPISAASPTLFGVGDGLATQFPLVPGSSQISNIVAQIYRNDWQGNQLLYATARTNYLKQSRFFSGWSTVASGSATAAITPASANGPDGTVNSAARVVYSATSAGQIPIVRMGISIPNGVPMSPSVWVLATTSMTLTLRSPAASTTNIAVTGSNAWQRLSLPASLTGSTFYNFDIGYGASQPGATIYVDCGQMEESSAVGVGATSYIPTTTAAVTVTDYALSPYGLVTLASAPLLGASLTWTGSYLLNTVSIGGDVETGNDLETAILISLFTDRIAAPDDVIPDGTNDPRGWWGDAGETVNIGSRLWLLTRAKQTQETLQRAYDYIVEALQWMIDDGVVAKFDVLVEWTKASELGAQVVAYKQDGSTSATAYTWAWQGIN